MYIRVERLTVDDKTWEIVNDYPQSTLPLVRHICCYNRREIFDLNPNKRNRDIGMKITILATL
jgi:hypothetical protein